MIRRAGESGLYGLPCGINYPEAVKQGLIERLSDFAPETLAQTEIYVNTGRMRRDILAAFDDKSTRFLPKVRLVSQFGVEEAARNLPIPASGLRRRLELARLISYFLTQEPQFAARSSVFDLSDSLALLLSEMHEEGVTPENIRNLQVQDSSGHWQKSLQFLSIIFDFFGPESGHEPGSEEVALQALRLKSEVWRTCPPDHPVIVAGSTGSRGITAELMTLVASLPQGAVILPGVDFSMRPEIWDQIAGASPTSSANVDHPQERTSRIAEKLGVKPWNIPLWSTTSAPNETRNRLISLSLRPAPVTDQWMIEGPKFENVKEATADVTLIEAPDLRTESDAVALILRESVEAGETAALVTPDRDLARRVTAQLNRWGIVPDDSAGVPLHQTPPGRLLRHITGLRGRVLSSEDLLTVLKHPLCARGATGDEGRGPHLLWTRELEKYLRKKGIGFPDQDGLAKWAETSGEDKEDREARGRWAKWVAGISAEISDAGPAPLSDQLSHLTACCSSLVMGPSAEDYSELWARHAGREAKRVVSEFAREAVHPDPVSVIEFSDLFRAVLGRGLVREPTPNHPEIMIWGTLEARALGAERVILGGLNEGVWPAAAGQDPWFSRDMRRQAGLISPEQPIGLSAHDFQQAIGAPKVFLTRSKRDAEAEAVASRWLIRLLNLMAGMSDEGREALQNMRKRGDVWLKFAGMMDQPAEKVERAHRPSPRPPVSARPRQLSVTRIETLIRDPYDIYASRVLHLSKLDPLTREPDVRERGTAFHKIMEEFLKQMSEETTAEGVARFLATAERVLETEVAWPSARRVWLGRMRNIAGQLVANEHKRLEVGTPSAIEAKGSLHLPSLDFSLNCKADRIDEREDGQFVIYDYKTGKPPTAAQMKVFAVQLLLEAAILQAGGFDDVRKGDVAEVRYIGLNAGLTEESKELTREDINEVVARLADLIAAYDNPEKGYSARRMMEKVQFTSDFDHLSRHGEWADSDTPVAEDLE
ncbi:double-strand break repair protein AddB [Celeribacter litoreus]|uniref:double-strand break repair protein AddB n=1 Tax=Celeribacter litoreus TaxID=2876714 RepID=UPI001CD023DF|nr:double-strand break repair protein AddB [Celeribacter litoreus]MCA0042160.1 double-strand break repair protein AddB [Celeribacter litoreus]